MRRSRPLRRTRASTSGRSTRRKRVVAPASAVRVCRSRLSSDLGRQNAATGESVVRWGIKFGIVAAVGALAAGTVITLVSPGSAASPVASAFAVRGPHDDLTEGAAVIGIANTPKINGVPVARLDFLGAGQPGVRSEL